MLLSYTLAVAVTEVININFAYANIHVTSICNIISPILSLISFMKWIEKPVNYLESGMKIMKNYSEVPSMIKFLKSPIGYSLAAILATFLWGSAFSAVKVGYKLANIQRADIFMQLEFAGYRFVLASCIIIALCLFINRHLLLITRRQFVFIVKLGFVQTFLQYVFFYVGISMSSGVTCSIIAGTLTFFQLGLAYFLYRDNEISIKKVIAAMVGFSGVVFYLAMDNNMKITFGFGSTFMFAAMFFAAFGNVLYRKSLILDLNPLPLTALQMFLGGLGLMMIGGMKVGFVPFDMTSSLLLNLLYLSLVSAMSFLIWNSIMTYNNASKVSVYLFLIPIFGVILSSIILGESLNWYIFPALMLVSISIVVTVKSKASMVKGAILQTDIE